MSACACTYASVYCCHAVWVGVEANANANVDMDVDANANANADVDMDAAALSRQREQELEALRISMQDQDSAELKELSKRLEKRERYVVPRPCLHPSPSPCPCPCLGPCLQAVPLVSVLAASCAFP